MGEVQNFGVHGVFGGERMNLECAKVSCKGEMLFGGDVLVAKEQHLPIEQRLLEF